MGDAAGLIERIANQGIADRCEMNPNLVGATGQNVHCQ
jgi:hypothetical protein